MKSETPSSEQAAAVNPGESPISLEIRGKDVVHRKSGMVVHTANDHTTASQWVANIFPWLRMKIFLLIDSDRRRWTVKDLSQYMVIDGLNTPVRMVRRELASLLAAGLVTQHTAMWEQGKPKVYALAPNAPGASVVPPPPPPYNMWDDPRTFGGEVPADVMDKWVSMHGDDPDKWPGPGDKKDG